jgi:pyruvate carboxylase
LIPPELFLFPTRKDRGTKLLNYIGNVTVNGFPGIEKASKPVFIMPRKPQIDLLTPPTAGTKQIMTERGADGLVEWIHEQKDVLVTDTTFRDAHQSLLATRVRSHDMYEIAEQSSRAMHDAFSFEMWGSATFDVTPEIPEENPWDRLIKCVK